MGANNSTDKTASTVEAPVQQQQHQQTAATAATAAGVWSAGPSYSAKYLAEREQNQQRQQQLQRQQRSGSDSQQKLHQIDAHPPATMARAPQHNAPTRQPVQRSCGDAAATGALAAGIYRNAASHVEVTHLGGDEWRCSYSGEKPFEFEFDKPLDRSAFTVTITREGHNTWVFNYRSKTASNLDARVTMAFRDAGFEQKIEGGGYPTSKDFWTRYVIPNFRTHAAAADVLGTTGTSDPGVVGKDTHERLSEDRPVRLPPDESTLPALDYEPPRQIVQLQRNPDGDAVTTNEDRTHNVLGEERLANAQLSSDKGLALDCDPGRPSEDLPFNERLPPYEPTRFALNYGQPRQIPQLQQNPSGDAATPNEDLPHNVPGDEWPPNAQLAPDTGLALDPDQLQQQQRHENAPREERPANSQPPSDAELALDCDQPRLQQSQYRLHTKAHPPFRLMGLVLDYDQLLQIDHLKRNPDMLDFFLQDVSSSNPQLLQLILQNQEAFDHVLTNGFSHRDEDGFSHFIEEGASSMIFPITLETGDLSFALRQIDPDEPLQRPSHSSADSSHRAPSEPDLPDPATGGRYEGPLSFLRGVAWFRHARARLLAPDADYEDIYAAVLCQVILDKQSRRLLELEGDALHRMLTEPALPEPTSVECVDVVLPCSPALCRDQWHFEPSPTPKRVLDPIGQRCDGPPSSTCGEEWFRRSWAQSQALDADYETIFTAAPHQTDSDGRSQRFPELSAEPELPAPVAVEYVDVVLPGPQVFKRDQENSEPIPKRVPDLDDWERVESSPISIARDEDLYGWHTVMPRVRRRPPSSHSHKMYLNKNTDLTPSFKAQSFVMSQSFTATSKKIDPTPSPKVQRISPVTGQNLIAPSPLDSSRSWADAVKGLKAPISVPNQEHSDLSIPHTLVFSRRRERSERAPRRANPGPIDSRDTVPQHQQRQLQQQHLYYLRHCLVVKSSVAPLPLTSSRDFGPPDFHSGPPAIPAFGPPVSPGSREVCHPDQGHLERVFQAAPKPAVTRPANTDFGACAFLSVLPMESGFGPFALLQIVSRLVTSSMALAFLRVILSLQASSIALRTRPSITNGPG